MSRSKAVTYTCPHCSAQQEWVVQDQADIVVCTSCKRPHFPAEFSPSLEEQGLPGAMSFQFCPKCLQSIQGILGASTLDHCPHCGFKPLPFRRLSSQLPNNNDNATPEGDLKPAADREAGKPPLRRLFRTKLGERLLGERIDFSFPFENVFWLLSLSGDADANAVERAMQRTTNWLRLKKLPPKPVLSPGSFMESCYPQEEAEFRRKLQAIENPRLRFLHSLLWPCLTPELTRFDSAELEGQGIAVQHSRAVLAWYKAANAEFEYLQKGGKIAPAKVWHEALELWKPLLTSAEFYDFLADRADRQGVLRLDKVELAELEQGLPGLLLGFNRVLAVAYLQSGDLAGCARHMTIIRKSGFAETAVSPLLRELIKELGDQYLSGLLFELRGAFKNCSGDKRLNHGRFAQLMQPLMQRALESARLLRIGLHLQSSAENDLQMDAFARQVVNVCESCLVYKPPQRERNLLQAILVLEDLLELPLSEAVRSEVQTKIRENRNLICSREYGGDKIDYSHCWFLPGERPSPEHSLTMPVYRITTMTLQRASWECTYVLIPRSAVAASIHNGVTNVDALIKKHPELVRNSGENEAERRECLTQMIREAQGLLVQLQQDQLEASQGYEAFAPQLQQSEQRSKVLQQAQNRLSQSRKRLVQGLSKGIDLVETGTRAFSHHRITQANRLSLALCLLSGLGLGVLALLLLRVSSAFSVFAPLFASLGLGSADALLLQDVVSALLPLLGAVIVHLSLSGKQKKVHAESMQSLAALRSASRDFSAISHVSTKSLQALDRLMASLERLRGHGADAVLDELMRRIREWKSAGKEDIDHIQELSLALQKTQDARDRLVQSYNAKRESRMKSFAERLDKLRSGLRGAISKTQVRDAQKKDKDSFPPYRSYLKQGYRKGKKPSDSELREERVRYVKNMSTGEVDREFNAIAMGAGVNGMMAARTFSNSQKRDTLLSAARAS